MRRSISFLHYVAVESLFIYLRIDLKIAEKTVEVEAVISKEKVGGEMTPIGTNTKAAEVI